MKVERIGYAILAWDCWNPDSTPGWRNSLVFVTEGAAKRYATDLYARWTACMKIEVIKVDEAPTLDSPTVRRFEEIERENRFPQ